MCTQLPTTRKDPGFETRRVTGHSPWATAFVVTAGVLALVGLAGWMIWRSAFPGPDSSQLPSLAKNPYLEGLPGWTLVSEERTPHSDFMQTTHASVTRKWTAPGRVGAVPQAFPARYGTIPVGESFDLSWASRGRRPLLRSVEIRDRDDYDSPTGESVRRGATVSVLAVQEGTASRALGKRPFLRGLRGWKRTDLWVDDYTGGVGASFVAGGKPHKARNGLLARFGRPDSSTTRYDLTTNDLTGAKDQDWGYVSAEFVWKAPKEVTEVTITATGR